MTIDEAIKHCDEVAERNEKQASWFWGKEGNPNYEKCVECASEHRQLAEWLRELKAYRDEDDCDYKTLKIKLENAEDIIRGLQEDLRDAREELMRR